jgi:hypothetical protein
MFEAFIDLWFDATCFLSFGNVGSTGCSFFQDGSPFYRIFIFICSVNDYIFEYINFFVKNNFN